MANWIREYRFSAGQAGSAGFGINELHINFSVEKSDVSSPNTAKISLWNLSPAHKAALEKRTVLLRSMPVTGEMFRWYLPEP